MNNPILLFCKWFLLEMPIRILENGKNFMVFCWRYFSVGFFLRRLLSPWHKDVTSYGRGFIFGVWMRALAWNFISRLIGAVLRLFFVGVGLVAEAGVAVATAGVFVFWFAQPAILIYLIFSIFT